MEMTFSHADGTGLEEAAAGDPVCVRVEGTVISNDGRLVLDVSEIKLDPDYQGPEEGYGEGAGGSEVMDEGEAGMASGFPGDVPPGLPARMARRGIAVEAAVPPKTSVVVGIVKKPRRPGY